MGGKYHVTVDGTGYLVGARSYRRSAAGGGSGWRTWQQSDWRRGDGQRVQADAGRWWGGCGVDASGAGRLSLGAALASSYASNEDGFAAMVAGLGKLYAASSSSGMVYSFDGTAWSMEFDTTETALRCLCRHGGKIYVGSGSDGVVFRFAVEDGWVAAVAVADAVAIGAIASYGLWDPVDRVTKPQLWAAAEFATGGAKLCMFTTDGTFGSEVFALEEGRVEAMAVYGGRLYVATGETGNGLQGRLLCFDGRAASGEWTEVAWIPDNYVAGMAVFDGLLFCGSGVGGRVWAFDGSRLVEAYDLADQGLTDPGPLRALAVCGGRLYVGYDRPTDGAALLCKLSAAVALDTVVPVSGGGDLAACRLGWSTPSAAGAAGGVRSMASYGGALYLARDAAGGATIYRRDAGTARTLGRCDLSDFDGGDPGQRKLLRRVAVSHGKLAAGDLVRVYFALEGTDLFQWIEGFDDLSGCDVAATTADWRVGESLGRLRGCPAQTFAGKQPGNPTVPHVGRKLAGPDPNAAAAAFVEELTAGEYSGIGVVGGGVAVYSSATAGHFAAMLFELSVAGLQLYGLHPRAVAYGVGDSLGAPYHGVTFRIWNHETQAWDPIGSNDALAGDTVAARTIEGTLVGAQMARYVSPSGRVYLSLRCAMAGSVANPATVGVDFAGLDALWSPDGDLVSGGLVLPVAGTVSQATVRLLDSVIPAGCGIALQLTADGGLHWEAASDGVLHVFANSGGDLRWRAVLAGPGTATPVVGQLVVDVEYGAGGGWVLLGTSDVAGSTGGVFEFAAGAVARRLGLRVELGATAGQGPVLTGISLEYSPASGGKRQWRFAARCEGVPGLPLRLLDGSSEGLTGAQLSQRLWAARAREVVSFVDLDGAGYTAWFEGLEETLGELAQEGGSQAVADCRLLEC